MSNSTFAADRIARIRGTKNSPKTTRNRAQTAPKNERASVEKPTPKRAPFEGLCCLCGLPAKRRYCHAHSWAEGT